MILFYTGAVENNAPQALSEKSLGGYCSNSVVPNDLLSNIFSSLSEKDIENKQQQLRCIVLKNTLPTDVKHISIKTLTEENNKALIKIGYQEIAYEDHCKTKFVETLSSQEQLPYYIEFKDYSTLPLTINSLLKGEMVFLWLLREIKEVTEPIGENDGDPNYGLSDCEIEFNSLTAKQSNVQTLENFQLLINFELGTYDPDEPGPEDTEDLEDVSNLNELDNLDEFIDLEGDDSETPTYFDGY